MSVSKEQIHHDVAQELTSAIGEGKVDNTMPTRIAYRGAHSQQILLQDLDYFTPEVVVWPESVEDVQKVVKIANEWQVPIVPQGGRTATSGAEGMKGSISLNLCRMNKLLHFDEKRYRFTAEAGANIADLAEYAARRGYMILDIPGMFLTSQLGSRVAVHGHLQYTNRWGSLKSLLEGIEVVLPTGEVVQLGRGTNGIKIPVKSGVGFNLADLFLGSRGTLGIVTKVTEQMIRTPESISTGMAVFNNIRAGIGAFVEIKTLCSYAAGEVWRARAFPKQKIDAIAESQEVKGLEEGEWVVEYGLLGSREVINATQKEIDAVIKSNGGSTEDLGELASLLMSHGSMEKYMGLGVIKSERLVKGSGVGNRIIPLDAAIADTNLVEFLGAFSELTKKIEDGKSYPDLSKAMAILHSGAPTPLELGFSKFWAILLANIQLWDSEVREQFKFWFTEYAELVWRFGGSLTATHGFIPRELEVDLVKREIGEEEYKFMCKIKDFFDPNHIMNPKVRFEF
jgi:FAD/FMN-containing dehydrogenase